MTFLAPPDVAAVAYEFFAPFAHVEGRFEWCRIRSPTHGVFDAFILVGLDPVVVYVRDDAGAAFMAERYPECRTFRVPPEDLRIEERDEGRTVTGRLRAREGPVRDVEMVLAAGAQARVPEAVPYGGKGGPVWGSRRWTCWGVDLVLRGHANGNVDWADGRVEALTDEPALVTQGSFGRIAPLERG